MEYYGILWNTKLTSHTDSNWLSHWNILSRYSLRGDRDVIDTPTYWPVQWRACFYHCGSFILGKQKVCDFHYQLSYNN